METRWSVPKKAGAVVAALLAVVITYQIVFALRDRPSALRGASYYNEDLKEGIGASWRPSYLPDVLEQHLKEVKADPEVYLAEHSTPAVAGAQRAALRMESERRELEREERKEEHEWELDVQVEDLLEEQESRGAENSASGAPLEEMEMESVADIEGLAEVMEAFRRTLRRHYEEATAEEEEEGEGLLPLPRVAPLPGLEAPLAFCKQRPIHDSHTCFHMVGHALADYGHTVPAACLHASADEGCLHGFAERWFSLYGAIDGTAVGEREKAERIAAACAQLPDHSRGDCLHAAAHYLMQDLAGLHAALAVCREMGLGEAVACGSGAYMLAAPPFSSGQGLLASPCLQELLPWECLRYAAQGGAAEGLRPMDVFHACQRMEAEGANAALVLGCFVAFGDLALFPHGGGMRSMTPIDVHAVRAVIMSGDERLRAMLLGGHRTVSLLPIGDYRSTEALVQGFCSTNLQNYVVDDPLALQLCIEIIPLPVHCVYCEDIHRILLPTGALGQLHT